MEMIVSYAPYKVVLKKWIHHDPISPKKNKKSPCLLDVMLLFHSNCSSSTFLRFLSSLTLCIPHPGSQTHHLLLFNLSNCSILSTHIWCSCRGLPSNLPALVFSYSPDTDPGESIWSRNTPSRGFSWLQLVNYLSLVYFAACKIRHRWLSLLVKDLLYAVQPLLFTLIFPKLPTSSMHLANLHHCHSLCIVRNIQLLLLLPPLSGTPSVFTSFMCS